VILCALELEDMEPIRKWRNSCLETLRTPFPLTKEQQEQWYFNEICDRNSHSRFWGIINKHDLIGYGGIENIQWENSIGEISLLIDPVMHNKGLGTTAAYSLLDMAFNVLNLHTIWAECYENNPASVFWDKVFEYKGCELVRLPNRKYSGGKYYDSFYYSVSKQ
jgi:RimJ/RimL family protein N-acetyltransferase